MSGRSGFGITVTAYDAATKEIDKINRSISQMTAPAARFNQSLSKLADTTGVRSFASGMRDVARESLNAFEAMGRMVPVLGTLTGAASLAGLAKLTSEWAAYGTALQNTAARTGVSVNQLSSLQGAARLAGSSAEDLSSGMKALKDNIFEMAAGRAAPMTIAAFNTLGISTRDATGHMRKAADVLPELADKISQINDPTQQATLATLTLGAAGENLLPFLRRGSAGIAEYTAKAKEYGAMSDTGAAAADRLREKQVELSLAVEGVRNSIAEKLEPVLGPMLEGFAKWLSANRNIIGQDIAQFVAKAAPEIKKYATEVNDVVTGLGGWERVLNAIIAINVAGWAAGFLAKFLPIIRILALIPGSGVTAAMLAAAGIAGGVTYANQEHMYGMNQKADVLGVEPEFDREGNQTPYYRDKSGKLIDETELNKRFEALQSGLPTQGGPARMADPKELTNYFRSQGWSDPQIAGILGSVQGESGFNAAALGDNGKAAGLFQLRGDRRLRFKSMFGKDASEATPLEQAQYVQWELTHSERAAGDKLRAQTGAAGSGDAVSRFFERPGDVEGEAAKRSGYAEAWLGKMKGFATPVTPPQGASVEVGNGAGGPAAQATTINGSADVNVNVKGVPAGSTASVKTSGAFKGGKTKVAMQPEEYP